LIKEALKLTIQFMLRGAYQHDEPETTHQMLSIQAACPSLFDLVFPAIDDEEEELELHGIQRSATQIHISVAARLQARFCTNVLRLPITSMQMEVIMRTLLGRAYSEDYDMLNVVDPSRGPLHWFKKFSYTSMCVCSIHSLECPADLYV
jgi:hypothetical protein